MTRIMSTTKQDFFYFFFLYFFLSFFIRKCWCPSSLCLGKATVTIDTCVSVQWATIELQKKIFFNIESKITEGIRSKLAFLCHYEEGRECLKKQIPKCWSILNPAAHGYLPKPTQRPEFYWRQRLRKKERKQNE